MPTLTLTRGLPASGKSVWARERTAAYGDIRVSRDDLRRMLFGTRTYLPQHEAQVTVAEKATVEAALQAGYDVIVDAMHLRNRYVVAWAKLAERRGAELVIEDFSTPVDECVRRDALRPVDEKVGEEFIRATASKFIRNGKLPALLVPAPAPGAAVTEPYIPPVGAPTAIMVDVDGTVALMSDRSPYDEGRVHEDRPNAPVIEAVQAMHAAGHTVIFCSGRTEACREATEKWLHRHVKVPFADLHMREVGDMRKDSAVKLELFDRHIRKVWDVVAVFDDRNQVVDMWRSIGLACFQVAPGDF